VDHGQWFKAGAYFISLGGIDSIEKLLAKNTPDFVLCFH